jgi:xanthine dehydrogenase YagS FAD-binding subunit
MKEFVNVNAKTVDEAVAILADGNAMVWAGGTDLYGYLKAMVSPDNAPEVVVNIKTIPTLYNLTEEGGMLKIGALVSLADIASSSIVQSTYTALAEAAHKVGTPELRNMGTIGGNICQFVRCWYYRAEYNSFDCLRKNPAGGICQALLGDNRYHSIFGAVDGCVAVNPSDTAPALVALDAKVVTTKQTAGAEDFFAVNGEKTTILDDDEIVTEIQIPAPASGTKSTYLKFAIRKAFDFPIVGCAVARNGESGRICLGAVHNLPRRVTAAEDALPDANAAAEVAVDNVSTLPGNKYMAQIAKVLVKRAVEATA